MAYLPNPGFAPCAMMLGGAPLYCRTDVGARGSSVGFATRFSKTDSVCLDIRGHPPAGVFTLAARYSRCRRAPCIEGNLPLDRCPRSGAALPHVAFSGKKPSTPSNHLHNDQHSHFLDLFFPQRF